jgi:hypothetical protein
VACSLAANGFPNGSPWKRSMIKAASLVCGFRLEAALAAGIPGPIPRRLMAIALQDRSSIPLRLRTGGSKFLSSGAPDS